MSTAELTALVEMKNTNAYILKDALKTNNLTALQRAKDTHEYLSYRISKLQPFSNPSEGELYTDTELVPRPVKKNSVFVEFKEQASKFVDKDTGRPMYTYTDFKPTKYISPRNAYNPAHKRFHTFSSATPSGYSMTTSEVLDNSDLADMITYTVPDAYDIYSNY